ncbi:MAG TPA: hypothetical protein VFY71_04910 [Planctomycetota bacterium]|nr:hypothetical protein [Planctomycetota bacterium]
MIRNTLIPCALLAATFIAPAALAGPGADSLQFAQEIKARLDTLKDGLKALDTQFASDIGVIQDDYLAGTSDPPATHLAVFELVNALDGDVAALLRGFTDGVEADASAHLQGMLAFPNAFAVGDGGLIDGAAVKASKARVKSTVANFKKVHKLALLMKVLSNYDLIFDRRGQVVEPMTPSEVVGEGADAPLRMLRVDLLMAGSGKPVEGDGLLCLAGTADPGVADHVTVSASLPGGITVSDDAGVDPVSGRWSLELPGTLPEGNWAITVTLDTVSVSDSLAIQ